MTYKLTFLVPAHKEWNKLSPAIQDQFRKKLRERLENPHIPKDRLASLENCYKIKLRNIGYRLVYQVIDKKITISVISIGKRDKMAAYLKAYDRLDNTL